MSRGGFRGRGRGGGGGGGMGRDFVVPTGSDMTKNDWIEAMKKKPQHTGMLFPPLEPKNYATLPAPSADETKILEYAGTIHDLLHKGTLVPGHRAPTPWRMVGERKVVGIEIETYSGTSAAVRESSTQQNGIDIPSMFLDKSLFPPALWKEVFEGENLQEGNKRKREEKERIRRKKRLEEGADQGDEPASDDEEKSQVAGSEDDGNGDFDFEDDEEEDHQDYDANYFDNGEGDDDDDGVEDDDGGEGGATSWD